MESSPDTVRPAHIPAPGNLSASDAAHALEFAYPVNKEWGTRSSIENSSAPGDSASRHPVEETSMNHSVADTSVKILDIIFDYALNKFSDTKERLEAGKPKFLSVINKFVATEARVEMCLPAFPFKSANKVYKVFGILPDKAEEIALERLNTMCLRIEKIYKPGARCTIISDGLVYNGSFECRLNNLLISSPWLILYL